MNIIKKMITMLTAVSMLFAFVSCKGDEPTETTTAEPSESATEKHSETPTATNMFEGTWADAETTEIVSVTDANAETTQTETAAAAETTTENTTTAAPTTTQASTTAKTETTTKKTVTTTKKPETTTKKPTTTKKKATAPTKKADIVKLYNTAAANAAKAKPGYKKSTVTELSNLNMGALASISAVRDAIGGFLGEGSTNSTVKKGTFDGVSLVKSTLKESDVVAATCKVSSDGKYYTVNITVKNEQNPKKNGSALGRFTKDFKDIDEIKAGLADVGASVETMTINTTSVTITAKIDTATNRFVSLSHNIKMNANLKNIKYIVRVAKASMNLETNVNYSDFKY